MAEREPGFYWVKVTADAEGEPAYWNRMVWTFAGEPCSYNDDELAEIGERVVRRSVTADATLAGRLVDYDLTAPTKYLRFPGFEDNWPEPQPITEAQRTGERFLVWWNEGRGWVIGWYSDGQWRVTHDPRQWINGVTHYLQLPPDLNPAPQRE